MRLNAFSRMELLVGAEALAYLAGCGVAVFGLGGVGSFAAEALAWAGVGRLVLVDDDFVCLTNLNRQLPALTTTIGRPKVEVMRERILAINPRAEVTIHQTFYRPELAAELIRPEYAYLVDAIDSVGSKIDLIVRAQELGVPVVSCMGAGNKLDPTRFEVADIYGTSVCPLARVMRRELRKRGVKALQVVYSREEPLKPVESTAQGCAYQEQCPKSEAGSCGAGRRQVPGSVSFVPSVAGLIAAGVVVRGLLAKFEDLG